MKVSGFSNADSLNKKSANQDSLKSLCVGKKRKGEDVNANTNKEGCVFAFFFGSVNLHEHCAHVPLPSSVMVPSYESDPAHNNSFSVSFSAKSSCRVTSGPAPLKKTRNSKAKVA